MKERLLDIVKWALILAIGGAIFYVVYPKYFFGGPQGLIWYRANKVTGYVERWDRGKKDWQIMGKRKDKSIARVKAKRPNVKLKLVPVDKTPIPVEGFTGPNSQKRKGSSSQK